MASPTEYRGFNVEQAGAVTVVRFTIPRLLKEATVESLGEQLLNLIEQQGRRYLVLDWRQVERVYSGMLAKLINLHNKVNSLGGQLALCQVQPEVFEVFQTLRLNHILRIYGTEAEAVQALSAAAPKAQGPS
jgi:stage II sporulation protein AA (anti-sigma F factor antagonist)